MPLLPKSEISNFLRSSVAAHAGLCQTWKEIPKTGFLVLCLSASGTGLRSLVPRPLALGCVLEQDM